jgi:hypothetical protein
MAQKHLALPWHWTSEPQTNSAVLSTFSDARVLRWTAHCLEQLRDGRLIRPEAEYTGPVGLHFNPAYATPNWPERRRPLR